MADVPWAIVFGVVIAASAFVAGVWLGNPGLMYIGVGGIMGLGWGVVEGLEWARHIERKYKHKEAQSDG